MQKQMSYALKGKFWADKRLQARDLSDRLHLISLP